MLRNLCDTIAGLRKECFHVLVCIDRIEVCNKYCKRCFALYVLIDNRIFSTLRVYLSVMFVNS